jgi:hypothetical protein
MMTLESNTKEQASIEPKQPPLLKCPQGEYEGRGWTTPVGDRVEPHESSQNYL